MDDTLAAICADFAEAFGLSRPAGQCFAAIWAAPEPPTADMLVGSVGISRSNVSTALKELRAWGLVAIERRPGDRKEYFLAPAEPWEIARLVLAGRRRRVLAPLLERLLALEGDTANPRVASLHDTADRLDSWLAALALLSPAALRAHAGEAPGKTGKKKKKKKA